MGFKVTSFKETTPYNIPKCAGLFFSVFKILEGEVFC